MDVRKAKTQYDFFSIMLIRTNVFILEQHVDPAIEIDEEDKYCDHYIIENENNIVGCCRVLKQDDCWHLGRIAIYKEYRNKNYGRYLLEKIESLAQDNKVKKLELGAQINAQGFYEKVGFHSVGDVFIEANIQHIMMEKLL